MKRSQTHLRPTSGRILDDHDLIRAVGGGGYIHSAPWSVNDSQRTSSAPPSTTP
jgi:hypothetical protein